MRSDRTVANTESRAPPPAFFEGALPLPKPPVCAFFFTGAFADLLFAAAETTAEEHSVLRDDEATEEDSRPLQSEEEQAIFALRASMGFCISSEQFGTGREGINNKRMTGGLPPREIPHVTWDFVKYDVQFSSERLERGQQHHGTYKVSKGFIKQDAAARCEVGSQGKEQGCRWSACPARTKDAQGKEGMEEEHRYRG